MGGDSSDGESLASHLFRALRFVFSMERNRTVFRRIFPPDLFAAFIDVGHYEEELQHYAPLSDRLAALPSEARVKIIEALEDINAVKGDQQKWVRDYAVQELLGRGGFGSVYQVNKERRSRRGSRRVDLGRLE